MTTTYDDRTATELHKQAADDEILAAQGFGRCCNYCGFWFDHDDRGVETGIGPVHRKCYAVADPDELVAS
jgi:hypothetical protein